MICGKYLLIALCLISIHSFSQDIQLKKDTTIYTIVDEYPVLLVDDKEYKINELKQFIVNHIQFPNNGNDCFGRVYISFIVEINGEISHKRLERKLCSGFDENAMKVIDLMKNWKAGIINKKAVRTKLIIPINFMLY